MTDELKKILYVEDDEDIAEVAVMTLEDIGGLEVQHCLSGRAAIDEYANYAPQLVLMDVMMPELDGPETMRHLQRIYGDQIAPVIFITAKAQLHEQQIYKQMGALGVVVKPFDPMTLCQKITEMWDAHHAA